ncbi:hypothetical protein [Kitasatospora sp. NPDC059673]|uniref:hypothetical protein n=1 Tax=Kitasatospora sp. NPDC059673 TaxID=3346901 RepID=UPI0036791BDB
MRDAIAGRLGDRQWGGYWACWEYAPLTPQPEGAEFLPHAAREIAGAVERLWRDHLPTVEALSG